MLDFTLSEGKITDLIRDYHRYMALSEEIRELQAQLVIEPSPWDSQRITVLQLKQKYLWESMKYDNPFIWLEYKRRAYAETASSVRTIGDLKKHCQSPTYICHKRLMFLHGILKRDFGLDIFSDTIDSNILLIDFLENGSVQAISQNPTYMQEWLWYEYFSLDGRTAKWENYPWDSAWA